MSEDGFKSSADIDHGEPDVRLGSLADIGAPSRDVRFALQVGGGRLIAERRSPPFIESVARQAGYDSPLVRMTLIGVDMSPNIQIVIDPYIVINPGEPNERVEPIHATAEMQVTFDNAGRELEAYCMRR